MKPEEIVQILKEQYNRDLRKQIVKSVLSHEKHNDKEALQSSIHILNQIFSYVLSELSWSMSDESSTWDETPLEVMRDVFPKIETTKWYTDQLLQISQSIKVEGSVLRK